ncbi:hypothetical protein HCTV-16_gp106 [Haloarcula virus HCTV-16]|nr:hypothetical protein HCTV-16_gp106 [Haloarcula virus HCTV-16]
MYVDVRRKEMSDIDDALGNLSAIKNGEDPTKNDPAEHGVCPMCLEEVDDDHFNEHEGRDPQPQPDENERIGLHTGGSQIAIVTAECHKSQLLARTEEGGVEVGTSMYRVRNGFDEIGDEQMGEGPNDTGQRLSSDKIDDDERERIVAEMDYEVEE